LSFFFHWHGRLRALHSFPTRRSSDLTPRRREGASVIDANGARVVINDARYFALEEYRHAHRPSNHRVRFSARARRRLRRAARRRSEEHTSELQSRENLVCRLLLEKKK